MVADYLQRMSLYFLIVVYVSVLTMVGTEMHSPCVPGLLNTCLVKSPISTTMHL